MKAEGGKRLGESIEILGTIGRCSAQSASAGCASGPHYWTKPGATSESFVTDHTPASPRMRHDSVTGIGSEKAGQGLHAPEGWTRIQGYANEPPKQPHFRGPEGDYEFHDGLAGRPHAADLDWEAELTADDPRPALRIPGNARAPGTVCP